MLTNVALASFGTRVMADSFFPWYRTWPVNDGKRNELDETGRWGKVRWLSAPTAEPHWLQILFPGPQALSRVEIHWARDTGRYLMPRTYWLERWHESGWVRLNEAERIEEPDGRCTVITFDSLVTDRLRLYMPAGAGREGDQANILGVAEFEAYSPRPVKGDPSTVVVLPAVLESRSNPFWLNWAEVPGATGYLLSYSRSPQFEAGQTTEVSLSQNYYMPPAPLEAGRWYWRVAPVLQGVPGPWSEPAVVELESAFTYQVPQTGAWKASHPRLPWADVDREALLTQVAGPKQAIWDQIREVAREAVPHVAQIKNMQDDGTAGDGLPAEPPGFDDGFWTIERWREIVAAGAKVLEAVTLNTFVFAVSGDVESREAARRWMLHAALWDPVGSTGINSVDHAAHDVLIGLSAGYDGLYHYLTPEERDLVRTAIVLRCRDLWKYLNPFDNDPNNNHPWFQTTALAVGAMAVWDEVEEAAQWVDFAIQIYIGRYLSLGGVDGEWHEGSDYWTYSLGFVFDFCDAIRSVTGVNLYDHPWLQRTAKYKLYVAPPGGPGLSFGDTHKHAPNGEDAAQMFRLASVHGDGYAQWYGLEALKGAELKRPGLLLRLMLWWDPAVRPLSPEALPKAYLFREAGFAKLHTTLEHQGGTHFALHSGRYHGLSGGHAHADQNHFMLYAGGESLAVDSGCYDYYGSPHFNGWYLRTRAHNTILVDGQEQVCQRKGADGAVTDFLHTPAFDYLLADASAPGVYSGKLTRFHRHVLFLRPLHGTDEMGAFVMFDDLTAPEPASFAWLLHTHADPEIVVDGPFARFTVRRPRAAMQVALRAGAPLEADVQQGFPEGLNPTRAIPEEWHSTFRTATKASEQTFLSVLAPHGPEEQGAAVQMIADRAVRIERDGAVHTVWFEQPESGWQTDARVLATTENSTGGQRWMVVRATRLLRGSAVLLQAQHPVTLVWWRKPDGQGTWLCRSEYEQQIELFGESILVGRGETTR